MSVAIFADWKPTMPAPANPILTQAEQARDFAQSIVATVREPLVVLDGSLHVTFANRAFYAAFGVTPEETEGVLLYRLGNGQWDIPALRHLLETVIPQDDEVFDFAVTHRFETLGERTMLLNARKIWRPGNHSELLLLAFEDVTERTQMAVNLREAEERLRFATEAAQVGAWEYYAPTNTLVWDARCRELWGFAPDEPTSMDAAMARIHADDRDGVTEALSNALTPGGSSLFDVVYRVQPAGDTESVRYIQSKGRAFHAAQDTNYRLLGILQDVSEQKRLEAEVHDNARKNERIAETLQRSLLLTPPPDAFPGITLKTFYESAWDDALIGGDFFDVFAVAENVIGVVVGDVSGKGLEAATYTSEIKFVLRGFLRESGDPADALARLNRFVVDAERLDAAHLGSTYIALSLACINTRTGTIECATAGAEPPLIFRGDGSKTVEEVPTGGPMLGAMSGMVYDAYSYQLGANDLYIAYTDGITEARRNKVFWGQEGLVDAVLETAFAQNATLSKTAEEIARRAKNWADGRQKDDVCLLLVRRI